MDLRFNKTVSMYNNSRDVINIRQVGYNTNRGGLPKLDKQVVRHQVQQSNRPQYRTFQNGFFSSRVPPQKEASIRSFGLTG
jgi:hypothetical protein